MLRTRCLGGFFAAVIGSTITSDVLAASCRDELHLVAHQYSLSLDLPVSRAQIEERTVSPDDLARGEAVLPTKRPERTGEPEPALPSPSPAPAAVAEPASKADIELGSVKRTQMQALTQAAVAAHAQGDDEKCIEFLSRARAVSPPG